ncbi:MAG: hypothetical protein GQ535_15560 [Rhodobacteraceae bacterium]|nr:hypothetical protein [Paracoccaceae bacterium]
MKNIKITRTLKSVIDLKSMASIRSSDLISANLEEYNAIRRAAAEGRHNNNPRFVCSQCEHPVYAPFDIHRRPYWKHFTGAPQDCPWWTGNPEKPDLISARQFEGRQEGPLHKRIKTLVGKILESDQNADDVKIEKYVVAEGNRRKPDISALYNGVHTAFEIQLSTTQLPTIVAREAFYASNGIRLIWVTWDFQERDLRNIRQAFVDIYFSHEQNLFSLNSQIIERSEAERKLFLNVHAFRREKWECKVVSMDELLWNRSGLPFVFPKVISWERNFKLRWISCRRVDQYDWNMERSLLAELWERVGIEIEEDETQSYGVPNLIDVLCSLEEGKPMVSRQRNLIELANTFLSTKICRRFGRIFEFAAHRCGQQTLLQNATVVRKLSKAKEVQQEARNTPATLAVRALFPTWVKS